MRHGHRRKPPGTATPSAYRHRASRRLYTNLVGTLVSVLARISLLRSGRTSETLHELPDQQRDSDQEQIRNESTYNHHMRAEQSAYKAEQYGKRSRHRDCDP